MRVFVLLWLGWYLSGPAAEMVDFWDTPRQEMSDIVRVGGGLVALVGMALAIALDQVRGLSKRFGLALRALPGLSVIRVERALREAALIILNPFHSPPVQLRI